MKTIPEILDHVKKTAGIKNDYNLSIRLGLTPESVRKIRNNISIPSDDTCIKLANLAGEDAEKIILIAHAARAESKEASKIWNGILKKAIGFSIIVLLLSPTLSYTDNLTQKTAYSVYYVKWQMQQYLWFTAAKLLLAPRQAVYSPSLPWPQCSI